MSILFDFPIPMIHSPIANRKWDSPDVLCHQASTRNRAMTRKWLQNSGYSVAMYDLPKDEDVSTS